MSFIGLVTRKEEDTGVSLMAKIVTPSKKHSAKKVFKVKVKANALDDYSCCVIDHATAKSRIENSQDMMNLTDDMTLPYSGANGTVISYSIVNNLSESIHALTDYLAEDGTILGRPKFDADSSGAATGYLEITVSKGDAIVQSRIVVSVAGITADEVLASSKYSKSKLWALINGNNNGTYSEGSDNSPHKNIQQNLAFSNAKTLKDDNSVTPITVTWAVTDVLSEYLKGSSTLSKLNEELGGKSRISEEGIVSRPSYGAACAVRTQFGEKSELIPNEIIGIAESSTSSNNRRIRIGGIKITATLTLGDATPRVVVFDCATVSKYLTGKEIVDVVKSNMVLIKDVNSVTSNIAYKEQYDDIRTTISAPTSGGTIKLKAFTNIGVTNNFSDAALYLTPGTINNVDVTHSIRAANGIDPCDDAIMRVLNDGFVSDTNNDYVALSINFDDFKALGNSLQEFAILTNVSVSSYSINGDDLSSTTLYFECYAQIKIDTSRMP